MLGYVWLLGTRRYKVSLRDLVGGRWARFSDFTLDVGVAFLFWVVAGSVIAGLSYLLHFSGAEAARSLLPQSASELGLWVPLAFTAGFCEEVIFRGYLQRQFLALTGNGAAAVVLQAIVFGVGHMYQGAKGAIIITVYGALFGVLAVWRKSLRPGIIQHAGQDSISGIAGHFLTKFHYLPLLRF